MVKGGAVVPGGGRGGGRNEERGMGMVGWQMGGRRGHNIDLPCAKKSTAKCDFIVCFRRGIRLFYVCPIESLKANFR